MTAEQFQREHPTGFQIREEEPPVEKLDIFKFSDNRERVTSISDWAEGKIIVCNLCGNESDNALDFADHDLGSHIVNWTTGERK